jgi:hypothetical protein
VTVALDRPEMGLGDLGAQDVASAAASTAAETVNPTRRASTGATLSPVR